MAEDRNEGEGNRTADRQYREGVKEHVQHHDVQGAAQRARDAVDGPEGNELRRAEEEGKRHSKGEDPKLHEKG
ncbi:MAG TPA: hypothetical protein VD978_08770 [Azospirillum sp.]|nr:hypothetical protein [Azospirillum sp.]